MRFTHVLITRPQPEADQLAAMLAGTGLEPVVMPAYGFEAIAAQFPPFADNERLLLVFTSKRAVEFGLRQLPSVVLERAEVAAIGPATARSLEAAGVAVSLTPEAGFTSEDLLGHPALAESPGQAIIMAAPGGRDALESGLHALGWRVRMAHVYNRLELTPAQQAIDELAVAGGVISTWTSSNAMDHLAGLLGDEPWQAVCRGAAVVISERLAEAIRALGVRRVVVARGPGNDALREKVLDLT